jgi:hypothetical protein
MLMHTHDRAINHLHLAVVRRDDGIHQPVPDACFSRTVEAIVGSRIRPVPLGQIAPRRTRAQHPEDTVENPAILLRLRPTPIHRQQRLDNAPLEIRQVVSHEAGSDVSKLESLFEPTG